MEKEKGENVSYKTTPQEPSVVSEPVAMYGALQLDAYKRYTYSDYLTWIDDKRRELIDGFFHLMSAPMRRHAHVISKLSLRIGSFIEKNQGKCRTYMAPFDVRLPLYGSTDDDKVYDVLQPDICVVCDLSKLDEKGCIGAPDLVVEVLSPSSIKYDWNHKFNRYEAAGVREYWVVDPETKRTVVFILQPNGEYDTGTTYKDSQKAPVFIFEGLEIDLSAIFED